MEQAPNASDTEAQKQVMSPIVDHFVALQADFQKQLAALRELTDNWRQEKDPPNKLGNNKSDNLYERSDDDNSTVLIDANLVPRAVQQALDITEPSEPVTRQIQASIDSRDDSMRSLNAMKPSEGLEIDQIDHAALPIEIPANMTTDDPARRSATNSFVAEQSSKSDNADRSIGDALMTAEERIIVQAISESNPPRSNEQKSESDNVGVTRMQTSKNEAHDDSAAMTSIDETAAAREITERSVPSGESGRSSPNNGGGEVPLSRGICVLDTTNAEPGRSSSVGPETSSTPGLPNIAERQARIATMGNNGSLVEVGKSTELSEAFRFSAQNSNAPRQADISQQRTQNISSIVDVSSDVTRQTHERDVPAQKPSDQVPSTEIPKQNDESRIVAVETLLTAVKSLPEQFLMPFITAMKILSPSKSEENDTSASPDVQLMNQLNTLRSMEAEAETKTTDAAQRSTTTNVLSGEEKSIGPTTMLDDEIDESRLLSEKNMNSREKNPEQSNSDKNINKEMVASKIPEPWKAKARSSVPDITQQHQDVRSVRTDSNELNISQITSTATDLTSVDIVRSTSPRLTDRGIATDAEEMNKTATSNVEAAEPMEAKAPDAGQEVHTLKNSLETDTSARNNSQERPEGETMLTVGPIEETSSGESSNSHARSSALTSTTHDRSIIRESVELTITPSNALTNALSLPKEASNSSARNEQLLADNTIRSVELIDLHSNSSRDKTSSVTVSDSNTENAVSLIQSITETSIPQENSIIHEPIADHSPASREAVTHATDINKPNEQSLNDSPRVDPVTSISSTPSIPSLANTPVRFGNIKSPSTEVPDSPETALRRHYKNDTKPIVPRDAVHVSEKVEQTISIAYRAPASDDKNEATLRENVPVERNATDDLSITRLQIRESIVSPLTDLRTNLNDMRDRESKVASTISMRKSDDSESERTSDLKPSSENPKDDSRREDKLSASIDREIIILTRDCVTETETLHPSKCDIDVSSEDISRAEILNSSSDPVLSKDVKTSEKNRVDAVNILNAVTAVSQSYVVDINEHKNIPDRSCELTDTNNNPPNSILFTEHPSLVSYPNESVSRAIEELSRSQDDARPTEQTSNSATKVISEALKNLNMFFTSSAERKNVVLTIDEDSDLITANIGDKTPGISDTFEIKISESPVITVNDCAPLKNIAANVVECEAGQIENVDTIGTEKEQDVNPAGNEISVVARNEPVESPSKSSNNEPMENDTRQIEQPQRSVIARSVVKHRSRSPVKKIVRRKSPVKIIRKSTSAPAKNLAQKCASPNNTTVTKARATASEITKKSGRAIRESESRIRKPIKPATCAANDKTGNENKLNTKATDKLVKQSFGVRVTGDAKTNEHRNISTFGMRNVSITDNTNNNREVQSESLIIKKCKPSFSASLQNDKAEQSRNKIVKNNKISGKDVKMNESNNKKNEKIAGHNTKISKDDKMLKEAINENRKNPTSKRILPSRIPILMHRKVAQSTNIIPSNACKINSSDILSTKSKSTKLPVASSAVPKLKIQKEIDSRSKISPILQKIENNSKANHIRSGNVETTEITENTKDQRILKKDHAEENIKRQEEAEELPQVESKESELTLSGNLQAPNSTRDDSSANFDRQLEIENAHVENSDALSSDSEYSEANEDTRTAQCSSNHNSGCNSVEELTDAELLLEKTLNEIRSEISESEEEHHRSVSEESEDVTYSYEMESHDHDSVSSEVSMDDERAIASSELGDSTEENTYEELFEEEQTSEQSEISDKGTNDVSHDETSESEASRAESNEVAQEDEIDDSEPSEEIRLANQPRVNAGTNEKTLEVSRKSVSSDSHIVVTDPAITSLTKSERSGGSAEGIQSRAIDLQEDGIKLENASRIKREYRTTQNNTTKASKVTSAKSAKVGRRASTGSKEVKVERDDPLKGMDRARAPKKRFSLVASCIRRFEGEENTEKTQVASIERKRQGSPKTEREVSKRLAKRHDPLIDASVAKKAIFANVQVAKTDHP